jgi:hypothetical protein
VHLHAPAVLLDGHDRGQLEAATEVRDPRAGADTG